MIRDELLARLAGLRQARVGQVRVPHKPLLLLWLFGPPVASAALARQRAAMPFVHLEREIWDLRDATGNEIAPDAPERRG